MPGAVPVPVITYLSSPLERGFVRDTVERLPPIYYVAAEKALKDTRIVERHVKREPVKPRGLRTMIYYGS